jgi:peptide/nickel transport system substrate-binding protein
VAAQVYEGLFKFDQADITQLKPALAERYETNADKTVYTFYLRQNVYFHEDPCFGDQNTRRLTAEDVVFMFEQLCTPHRLNQSFHLVKGIVRGAGAYFQAKLAGQEPGRLEGVRVVDNHTVEVTLEKPNAMFLYNLARPGAMVFPKEALAHYGEQLQSHVVGTGPFKLSQLDEDNAILLTKHKKYYLKDSFGNSLPLLNAVHIRFIKEKKMELLEFKKGNLDMMYRLPTDHIIEILEASAQDEAGGYSQYDLQREPEMSTQFIAFNIGDGVFKDVHVRKAFSFAIDRKKILDYVLNGEGYDIGQFGFTPPSFKNYPVNQIKGYTFHLDSARYYLKKAGYPDGKGFPTITLDLNAEGERHTHVAVEIQKQLKDHLNIRLELNIIPIAQLAEKSTRGNYEMLRMAWVADYPSPENFLWKFYGKNLPVQPEQPSYPNFTRYLNPAYDIFYEKALNSYTEEEALSFFRKAEQVLINDAPVMVLWYDEGYRLLQTYVKNFPSNPMQFRDFTEVYLEAPNISPAL